MFLHVEAVNFDSTIFDTQDISTVRGSSRAIEDIIANFASQIEQSQILRVGGAAVTAKTDLSLSDLARNLPNDLQDVFPHLVFIEGRDAESDLTAIARARHRQHRQASLAPWGAAKERPCDIDKQRPASKEIRKGDKAMKVSASVYARRKYGKDAKSGLYQALGSDIPSALPQDFHDLVGGLPASEGIAEAAQSKLVVIHADGAGFGDAMRSVGSQRFSERLAELHAGLLKGLFKWLATMGARGVTLDGAPRLETLLFGGEDMDFVLPGWLVFDFLREFYRLTKDWDVDTHPLSHRLGCVVGHYKTPIRQLRSLAHDAVDVLRDCEGTNIYSIDIFESAAPPSDGLSAHRKRLFGAGVDADSFAERLEALEHDHSLLDALVSQDQADTLIARSQIYGLLQLERNFGSADFDKQVTDKFIDYCTRTNRSFDPKDPFSILPFSGGEALRLAKVAQLWDYLGAQK